MYESYSTGQSIQQPREILLMQLHSTQSNIKSYNSPDSDSSPLLHFKLKPALAEYTYHAANVKTGVIFSSHRKLFDFWGRYFVQDSNNDIGGNFVYVIHTRRRIVDSETPGSS